VVPCVLVWSSYLRDGYCRSLKEDHGAHTVAGILSADFVRLASVASLASSNDGVSDGKTNLCSYIVRLIHVSF
jgi:uncharacterized protein (DUF2237 family)